MAIAPISLIDALGMQELLPEEQEEMLLDLNALVWEGALVRMLEQMDAATKDEFEKLLDSEADEEEVETFLAQHVPGAEQAVTDTMKELTDDILAVTGESQD